MRRRRSSAQRASISAWLRAFPAGHLAVLDLQGPAASGLSACLMAQLVALPQHRVVTWLVCHHPVSVSQILLRVHIRSGMLCLARGSKLTDLLMEFREPTVKVQGGLH